MSEEPKQSKIGIVLKTELVISGVLLALGVEALLSDLDLSRVDWPLLMVRLGLLILVVWIAQLLTSWESLYDEVGADQFPLGGLPHLWVYVMYVGLVYLACNNHSNFSTVLLCLTLIVILDFIDSGAEWRWSTNEVVRKVNRNWIMRDLFPLAPTLVIGWLSYHLLDRYNPNVPSIWVGVIFLVGMAVNYMYDLWLNRKFYGTEEFWRALVKVFKWRAKQVL